jgi:hypothetical protein
MAFIGVGKKKVFFLKKKILEKKLHQLGLGNPNKTLRK